MNLEAKLQELKVRFCGQAAAAAFSGVLALGAFGKAAQYGYEAYEMAPTVTTETRYKFSDDGQKTTEYEEKLESVTPELDKLKANESNDLMWQAFFCAALGSVVSSVALYSGRRASVTGIKIESVERQLQYKR